MEPRSVRVKQLAEIFHTTSAYLLEETNNPAPEYTLPIENQTEQPQASEAETKSPTPLDLADKSIFEAIKSKDMLVYEKDIPAIIRQIKRYKIYNIIISEVIILMIEIIN